MCLRNGARAQRLYEECVVHTIIIFPKVIPESERHEACRRIKYTLVGDLGDKAVVVIEPLLCENRTAVRLQAYCEPNDQVVEVLKKVDVVLANMFCKRFKTSVEIYGKKVLVYSHEKAA